jgi:hypothetical protein
MVCHDIYQDAMGAPCGKITSWAAGHRLRRGRRSFDVGALRHGAGGRGWRDWCYVYIYNYIHIYVDIYIYVDVYDVYATIHCYVWSVACRQHMTTNDNDNDHVLVMTTTNDLVICSFICNHYPKLYGSYNAPTLWSIRNPFSTNTPIPSCTPWFERPRWRNRQSDSWWLRLQGAPDATTTQLWALFLGAVKVKAVRKFHEPSWQMWRQQEEANFSIIIIS